MRGEGANNRYVAEAVSRALDAMLADERRLESLAR
jgi:hypothetical protein